MARTIQSAGVEIKEIDLSLRTTLQSGTNVLVNGYTDVGPSQELLYITSLDEYERIYGLPKTAAERYSYHTVGQILSTPANLVFNRLPYGEGTAGEGDAKYSALIYPSISTTLTDDVATEQVAISEADAYFIPTPLQVELTQTEYDDWMSGTITWVDDSTGTVTDMSEVGNAAFVIINKLQTAVNENFEGYYVGVCDNLQSATTVDDEDFVFNSIESVVTNKDDSTAWVDISESRLNFNLLEDSSNTTSDNNGSNSISESLESIPTWEFGEEDYNDAIIIGLYKLRKSGYSTTDSALDFVGYEGHIGAFGSTRMYTEPNGFQQVTFSIAKQVTSDSLYMDVLVNPYLSDQTWLGDDGTPDKIVRMINETSIDTYGLGDLTTAVTTDDSSDALYPIGVYSDSTTETKVIGVNTPTKLSLGLGLADNFETVSLDIVVDAGLSEIHATMVVYNFDEDDTTLNTDEYSDDLTERGVFTDYTNSDTSSASTGTLSDSTDGASSEIQLAWQTIFNLFEVFAGETRQDCMVIMDTVRDIFVLGFDRKTLDNKSKNFSQHIYLPLKNLISKSNSNYAAIYGNWAKVYDNTLGDNCWVPFSGFQAAIEAKKDSNLYPWYAGAGLNNGIVRGILDISINPTQKQRDLLYKNNINPVVFFPGDGIIVWGQKTLQKKPSAFDRINVRRLFLTLEKATRATAKYFVFEPNTVFTRTRVINTLTPIFEIAKNNQGVYDYKIVCDERNNTPTVIDANEMVVDIYIKPVRTAEFILINFYATRTDQNFDELI